MDIHIFSMSIVYFYINHSLIFYIMARRRKHVEKINIDDKVRGNKLTAEEFNEVKNTVNELIDSHDEDLDSVEESISEINQSVTEVSQSIDELLSQSSQLLSYINTNKSDILNISELLAESSRLLNIHEEKIITAEELLAASNALLNNHETRLISVEELLQQSSNLLDGLTASEIPTTNSNVQQDIDDLLLQSQNLLSYINTAKEECKEYVDTSYNKLYMYIEDTTLTFEDAI